MQLTSNVSEWQPTKDDALQYILKWNNRSLRKLSRRRRQAIRKRLVIAYDVLRKEEE